MTLSVVELPPNVPQPSVNEQSSPVVIPQQPCAADEFTRIRPAGIARAKRSTRAAFVVWMTAVCPAPAISSSVRHSLRPSSSPATVNIDRTGASFSPV